MLNSLKHRFFFLFKRVLSNDIRTIFLKVFYKLLLLTCAIFVLPLSIIFHFVGVRCVEVFYERIGHFTVELACLIKEKNIKIDNFSKPILALNKELVPNQHFLNYLNKYFRIVHSKKLIFLINALTYFNLMAWSTKKYLRNKNKCQEAYKVLEQNKDKPIFNLTQTDNEWFDKNKIKLGIPKNSWYVVIHAREKGYSKIDDHIQSYRNGKITNLISSIKEISKRGGWIVRIGHNSSEKLPKMKNLIDYAHYKNKSDRLDICLIANAKFILGNTSGINCVGSIFGVPSAIANVIPLSVLWLTSKDLFIPKLIFSKKMDKYLSINEILKTIPELYYTQQYADLGLIPIENSESEIQDLVIDMFEKLEKKMKSTNNKISKFLNKKHYGFNSKTDVSKRFIDKYESLFS